MKWTETESKLMKTIKCQDFNHALALLNKIAVLAESMNHHPDMKIYSYRFLSIEIYTHDTNSITQKDYDLSKQIDLVLIRT
ncbi:MAG: 4a-hydroxytetrahydrobiopterin dehydratase [Crocinitomicaceae bacterium]